jgi:hypothetical protein
MIISIGKDLQLFRGKKKNEELDRLSKEKKDFEFRRLYIEENEKTLHVIRSRRFVSMTFAWGFLLITLFLSQLPTAFFISICITLLFLIFSLIFQWAYVRNDSEYKVGLIIVDTVIKQDYGISL